MENYDQSGPQAHWQSEERLFISGVNIQVSAEQLQEIIDHQYDEEDARTLAIATGKA